MACASKLPSCRLAQSAMRFSKRQDRRTPPRELTIGLIHHPKRRLSVLMIERSKGLASLGLDNAIRLRWVLRDIKSDRLKLSPASPDDIKTLVSMGYVEIKD